MRYLGIEVDDALEISEQTEIRVEPGRPVTGHCSDAGRPPSANAMFAVAPKAPLRSTAAEDEERRRHTALRYSIRTPAWRARPTRPSESRPFARLKRDGRLT